jgi:hypothetical protein
MGEGTFINMFIVKALILKVGKPAVAAAAAAAAARKSMLGRGQACGTIIYTTILHPAFCL